MYPVITKVIAPDLGPPSCAPWIFAALPASRWYGGATRFGRPDLGPPSQAARIFASLPRPGPAAQRVPAFQSDIDTPPAPTPRVPEVYVSPPPTFWRRSFAQTRNVDPQTMWVPNPWVVDSPMPVGWLQRTAVSIQQMIASVTQGRHDIPAPSLPGSPPDNGVSIAWAQRLTVVTATTAQLAGTWAQSKAMDPWPVPPWVSDTGPPTSTTARRISLVAPTAAQLAGIWSQFRLMDPPAAPNYTIEPSLWPTWLAVPDNLLPTPPPPPLPRQGNIAPQWIRRRRMIFGV